MSPSASEETAVAYLRSPLAIRARCENVLEAGLAGSLRHFAVELGALSRVVDEVVARTRSCYPTLAVPMHGWINQLRAGGVDRVAELDAELAPLPPDELARTWIDLIVVSVVLEGDAIASLDAFRAGMFSSEPAQPLRVDAQALRALDPARHAGRARALGDALLGAPEIFPGDRPGGLLDHLQWIAVEKRAPGGSTVRTMVTKLDAPSILAALLEGLAPIWLGGSTLGGTSLGDVWPHPAAGGTGPSAGLVPFHTIAQWLAYSLFEPFARAGLQITQAGALTGLPGYRTGGLLVDLGVLVPRHDDARLATHAPGDEVVVEWRALTVALLDRVAEGVRATLGRSPVELPLASILAVV